MKKNLDDITIYEFCQIVKNLNGESLYYFLITHEF